MKKLLTVSQWKQSGKSSRGTQVGASEKREVRNRMILLLFHLLKWRHQAEMRGASWEETIVNQRAELMEIISEHPSLKQLVTAMPVRIYGMAVKKAAAETGLAIAQFPSALPFTIEQILDHNFFPTDLDQPEAK